MNNLSAYYHGSIYNVGSNSYDSFMMSMEHCEIRRDTTLRVSTTFHGEYLELGKSEIPFKKNEKANVKKFLKIFKNMIKGVYTRGKCDNLYGIANGLKSDLEENFLKPKDLPPLKGSGSVSFKMSKFRGSSIHIDNPCSTFSPPLQICVFDTPNDLFKKIPIYGQQQRISIEEWSEICEKISRWKILKDEDSVEKFNKIVEKVESLKIS